MKIEAIVDFWQRQHKTNAGNWVHPDDEPEFTDNNHSFNLDFPVSPYVGDIVGAPVIILGANAGYDPAITPEEFQTEAAIEAYLSRVRNPSDADWSYVSTYYGKTNYGSLIATGRAALINACPYRSKKISAEPENRNILEKLPSTRHARRWLLDAVLPLAAQGARLVVAKRYGLWNLCSESRQSHGIVFDPAPVSPQITSTPWATLQDYLQSH